MRFHPPRANKGATRTGLPPARFSRARSMPTRTKTARKGLSWPANATDLCGLGRRLSASQENLTRVRSRWLIRVFYPPKSNVLLADRRDARLERKSERASAGKMVTHEEEKAGATEWTGERATSWSRTRNTMRAWVLASGDATTNEANPAILLLRACTCICVCRGTYILSSPPRRFHISLSPDSLWARLPPPTRARCASVLREIHAFPFLRTCRSEWAAAVNGDTCLVQVFWPTCAPRRRASRPRYLARGKLLGETLKPFCSHRDRETRRSLSRCSAERSENARYSSRMSGVITPIAFIAVIVRN